MDIIPFIASAQAVLISEGIPENTVKNTIVEEKLASFIRKAMRSFFGGTAPSKLIGFIMETEGAYGSAKTVFEKRPLAQASGWYWLFVFYSDSIPSNRSAVRKKSNNAENISILPDKFEAAHECDNVHKSNNGMADFSQPVFSTTGTVASAGVLNFATTQLLEVGQNFELDGIECTIATEPTAGLSFTFTSAETVPVGEAMVSYRIDTTGWQNYPKMSDVSLLNF